MTALATRLRSPAALAFAAGVLFGAGLWVSGMTQPAKVLGFLDLFGDWDPSLGLVMGGALAVTLPGFRWLRGRKAPFFAPAFSLPTKRDLDARLVSGALLFGAGWGLAGLCPGPAIAILPAAPLDAAVFFLGMTGGMSLLTLIDRPRSGVGRHALR